ncbi:MAG: STAS domain-containing protein [Deltaproteobacteria bacterium]|nr:STAS domain-containing protein [Candidatus Anaeroferrophillacea bacterium]
MRTTTHTDGTTELTFGPSLCIADVDAAHRKLLAALDDGGAVRLDLDGIETIDAAGLQLLIAAGRSAAEDGRQLTCSGINAVVTETARRAGCSLDTLPLAAAADRGN